MSQRAVHQLVPVLTAGDAIGEATLRLRALLRRLGCKSEIYADLIDRSLRNSARPASLLRSDAGPEDTVIYHLSIGSPLARTFAT
ncbi:MAG: glycosyl transferase family 1, partial [Candidatus Dormibacteraeota bacterium]|nr:glycosyl transferase family 1 [Candidatus Dormibacteraeota bacterium]